jgi:hypothetical protein
MDFPSCDPKNCIHSKEGRSSLRNPEKTAESCLDFEDEMDFLRLKADAIKGKLN